jgi:hypothetical protein
MNRDSLLFRFFEELPGCFFRLIGREEADAARYSFDSIEYKETAVRADGVFQARELEAGPAYLLEVQYYSSPKVYANLWSKIGRFLEHGDPNQDWVGPLVGRRGSDLRKPRAAAARRPSGIASPEHAEFVQALASFAAQ